MSSELGQRHLVVKVCVDSEIDAAIEGTDGSASHRLGQQVSNQVQLVFELLYGGVVAEKHSLPFSPSETLPSKENRENVENHPENGNARPDENELNGECARSFGVHFPEQAGTDNADANSREEVFEMKDDQGTSIRAHPIGRISRSGCFLRRTCRDELPTTAGLCRVL